MCGITLGASLLIEISLTGTGSRAWIRYYIHIIRLTFLIHPCPKFKDDLVKPALKLGHAWVVISHISYGCTCLCLIPTLYRYCISRKSREMVVHIFWLQPHLSCWNDIMLTILLNCFIHRGNQILFYFILFYSILFYSIPFYSMLYYAMLCYIFWRLISGLSYLKNKQFHFYHTPCIKNVYWYQPCH